MTGGLKSFCYNDKNTEKMKRILITLFLLSSFSIGICSAQSTQEAESNNNENSLLWRISGNGLQHDSYLLGTMHNVGRTFLDSISGFRKAFNAAKQVAIECDAYDLDNQEIDLAEYVYMPQDSTYATLYSDSDFQFVDSILREGNPQYFKYKPMFWCSFFTSMIVYQNIRGKETGMDRFILLIGEQNYKKTLFMETLEEVNKRTAYLDSLRYSINLKYQAASLKAILQYPETFSASMNLASKLYKEQSMSGLMAIDSLNKQSMNFSELENIQNEEKQYFKKMMEHFFEILGSRRNEQWMSNIIPMIHEDSSLIAVGALHLIGPDGLIAKLRERGYKVEPMR